MAMVSSILHHKNNGRTIPTIPNVGMFLLQRPMVKKWWTENVSWCRGAWRPDNVRRKSTNGSRTSISVKLAITTDAIRRPVWKLTWWPPVCHWHSFYFCENEVHNSLFSNWKTWIMYLLNIINYKTHRNVNR